MYKLYTQLYGTYVNSLYQRHCAYSYRLWIIDPFVAVWTLKRGAISFPSCFQLRKDEQEATGLFLCVWMKMLASDIERVKFAVVQKLNRTKAAIRDTRSSDRSEELTSANRLLSFLQLICI